VPTKPSYQADLLANGLAFLSAVTFKRVGGVVVVVVSVEGNNSVEVRGPEINRPEVVALVF
jgi:hypothetical protein